MKKKTIRKIARCILAFLACVVIALVVIGIVNCNTRGGEDDSAETTTAATTAEETTDLETTAVETTADETTADETTSEETSVAATTTYAILSKWGWNNQNKNTKLYITDGSKYFGVYVDCNLEEYQAMTETIELVPGEWEEYYRVDGIIAVVEPMDDGEPMNYKNDNKKTDDVLFRVKLASDEVRYECRVEYYLFETDAYTTAERLRLGDTISISGFARGSELIATQINFWR